MDEKEVNALCHISELSQLEKDFVINRVIFCIGENKMSEIIKAATTLSKQNKRFLFHTAGSNSMIGSQTLAPGTAVVVPEIDYNIAHPYQKRMKRLLDVTLAVLFLLALPLHFIFHPHPVRFIKEIFSVLAGSKTWVGYAGPAPFLPLLKPGILSPLGKSANHQLAQKADQLYARNYDWWQDFLIIITNYRKL